MGLLDECFGVGLFAQVGGDGDDPAVGGPRDFRGRCFQRLLRRAQMATSTPSFASASVMPLPMPSLPPVTSAVLP